jgi:hypothetical protein
MHRIIVRIRPREVIEDIDLDAILARIKNFDAAEIVDSRISDAPYVTVIVKTPTIDNKVLTELKSRLSNLQSMYAELIVGVGTELPIEDVDIAALENASQV